MGFIRFNLDCASSKQVPDKIFVKMLTDWEPFQGARGQKWGTGAQGTGLLWGDVDG
jgi:hypothetical protein